MSGLTGLPEILKVEHISRIAQLTDANSIVRWIGGLVCGQVGGQVGGHLGEVG